MLERRFVFGSILFLTCLCIVFGSCKENTNETQSKSPYSFHEGDSLNLLRFKVKEEHFKDDGLKLNFDQIHLYALAEGVYELKIELDSLTSSLETYAGSYLVFSIYPNDADIELLHNDRQKYKFESYSLKIKSNKKGKLFASRKIKTNLKYARAITIAVLSYKTKEKSMEIVLREINLTPK